MKVLYILNNAPNYRDIFLRELGKQVDLTVVSFNCERKGLKPPAERLNYHYYELSEKNLCGIGLNIKEFSIVNKLKPDLVLLGFNLRNVFRMLNLFRSKRKIRVIPLGLIYGSNDTNFVLRFLRKVLLNKAEGVLVYSKLVKKKLEEEIEVPIISFNNTSFFVKDIRPLPFPELDNQLNIIWVGRYQKRKNIERLIEIANFEKRISLRLIGPNIRTNVSHLIKEGGVQIFDEAYGDDLEDHFAWAHMIWNPGHVGLLVMNAARFGRPILIEKNVQHAPEIQLAIDAGQEFVDFQSDDEVSRRISTYIENPLNLENAGKKMAQEMNNYTIEFMVSQYMKAINKNWRS